MAITVSVLQGGVNSHETSSEEINFPATDFINDGVVGAITNTSGVAPATGAFAVNAQGTPDATVAVSSGVAYVTGTPTSGNSQTVRVKNSASANVTIDANSTGGTRYDWIYIKLDPDKLKDPAADASDAASLVTSRSTSASTDDGSPPTYGYNIAVVTVSNGFSTITNGNIADKRAQTSGSLSIRASTAEVTTSQTTTSTSPTNLSTSGPAVTVTIGASGLALIAFGAKAYNSSTADHKCYLSVALSGANTVSAPSSESSSKVLEIGTTGTGTAHDGQKSILLTGLSAGSTTFTLKYFVADGTGVFSARHITVIPL